MHRADVLLKQPLIEANDLSCTVAGQLLFDRLDVTVLSGDVLELWGPNGSGKSTLLRVLITALAPSSGTVVVGGASLERDPAAVRRQLGVVFQKPSLDGKMTVGENLQAAGLLYGMSRRAVRERTQALLAAVGLWDRRGERVDRLSGGMGRRVELAKALLPEPAILVLDEPTTGLDPAARLDFWRQVEALRMRGQLTVVATTHLLDEAERADRVAILHKGQLLVCETPGALQRQLGREILTLRSEDAIALQDAVQCEMGLEGMVADQALRIPLSGDISLDELLRRFRDRILSLAIAPPSLDDVFLSHTGQSLHAEEAP